MPGKSKKGGGLEVGSAYRMKNSMLHMSAKTGSPMQANYGSPMRDETKTKKTKKTLGEWFRGTKLGKDIAEAGRALQSDASEVRTKVEEGVSKVSGDITSAKKQVQGITQGIGDKISGDISQAKQTVQKRISKAKSNYADYKANRKKGESRFDYNIRKKREATGALAPR